MSSIPRLSPDGWETDPGNMVVLLFEYFLIADYSQSNTFKGMVNSLKYLLKNRTDDDNSLKNDIEKSLSDLYENYFSSVDVNVMLEEENAIRHYLVEISVRDENNKTHTLTKGIDLAGDTIKNFDSLVTEIKNYK